jgi:hypothetical protein
MRVAQRIRGPRSGKEIFGLLAFEENPAMALPPGSREQQKSGSGSFVTILSYSQTLDEIFSPNVQ